MRAIAVAHAQNRIDIFWIDRDFSMHHNAWNGTSWTTSSPLLGGSFVSVPAAVASVVPHRAKAEGVGPRAEALDYRVDVFAVGTDYAMYHKAIINDVAPAQWESLGGTFMSAPAAVAWNGRIDVLGVGLDKAMYHKAFVGGSWTPQWERLGAAFTSEAFALSWGVNRLDVFARGVDFSLRHRSHNGTTWSSDWQNLGGSLASPPVATTWGPNRLDVFAIGSDGQLCHRWWDGDIWNDWESLPLAPGTPEFASPPTATALAPDQIDVFAVGTDSVVRHLSWTNGSWNDWVDLGGSMTAGPTAIITTPTQIDVFAPGNDQSVYHRFGDGTAWQPANWEALIGNVRLPARFRFSLDYVECDNPRSLEQDTDYGQCSVRAGNWPIRTATESIGDIPYEVPDPGPIVRKIHTTQLVFDPVDLDYCEPVIFNYSVVNNGHDALATVDAFVTKSAEELIESIADIDGPLADYLLDDFFSVIFADCDGWVAVDQHQFLGQDVHLKTASGPDTTTQTYNGYDSPTGCGGNSVYKLTWTMARSD
jgi:hypothetical protein